MLPEIDLLLKAGINILSALILTYAIFYRRYRNRELFVSSMILNICVFCVMSIITDGNIGLQAGLGLFAILSILRFRSENFKKMDMAYFFGAVAIAAVNGIGEFGLVLLIVNVLILSMTFIIDGNFFMLPVNALRVCLDSIPKHIFDEERIKQELGKKFSINIIKFDIREIDYVKDTVILRLHFNPPDSKLNNLKLEQASDRGET